MTVSVLNRGKEQVFYVFLPLRFNSLRYLTHLSLLSMENGKTYAKIRRVRGLVYS